MIAEMDDVFTDYILKVLSRFISKVSLSPLENKHIKIRSMFKVNSPFFIEHSVDIKYSLTSFRAAAADEKAVPVSVSHGVVLLDAE